MKFQWIYLKKWNLATFYIETIFRYELYLSSHLEKMWNSYAVGTWLTAVFVYIANPHSNFKFLTIIEQRNNIFFFWYCFKTLNIASFNPFDIFECILIKMFNLHQFSVPISLCTYIFPPFSYMCLKVPNKIKGPFRNNVILERVPFILLTRTNREHNFIVSMQYKVLTYVNIF